MFKSCSVPPVSRKLLDSYTSGNVSKGRPPDGDLPLSLSSPQASTDGSGAQLLTPTPCLSLIPPFPWEPPLQKCWRKTWGSEDLPAWRFPRGAYWFCEDQQWAKDSKNQEGSKKGSWKSTRQVANEKERRKGKKG